MTFMLNSSNNPIGLLVGNKEVRLVNRTGSTTAIGEVYQLDLLASATEVTDNNGTDGTSGFGSFVLTAAAAETTNGTKAYPIVVCMEAIADDDDGLCLVSGIADILCVSDAGGVLIGEQLHNVAGQTDLESDVIGDDSSERCLAVALEAGDASAGPNLVRCLFDGLNGLGIKGGIADV